MINLKFDEPKTELAEMAVYQIALRIADYQVLSDRDKSGATFRHSTLSTGQLRSGNALVDIVAIVENFVSQRLLLACPSVREDDVFSWPKREKAWLINLQIDFTHLKCWQKVQGYIQVRNALQHGLGRLTDSQLTKWRDETLPLVKSSHGIELQGDRVRVGPEAVDACGDACRCLILELDRLA